MIQEKKDEEEIEEEAQQWEKQSTVENQQESTLQVNTSPHQLMVKEERHGDLEGTSKIHEFHGVSS